MTAALMSTAAAVESRQRMFATGIVARVAYMAATIPRFIAMEVVECLVSVAGQRSVISMTGIESVVHMAVEAVRAMEPGSCSNEHSTYKPVWSIVAIRSTVIRSVVEISVGANRGRTNADRDLSGRYNSGTHESSSNRKRS
jgi:hypothetical protein